MAQTETAIDAQAHRFLAARQRTRPGEIILWSLLAAGPLLFPDYAAFGAQILIMMLFALSLDMILGYAGILTLGHAVYFGTGAYAAGLLSARLGWNEPISGLMVAGAVGALLGFLTGGVLLRYSSLALLMLTLALGQIMVEIANGWSSVTGGFDGLVGIRIDPLLGYFEWDIAGQTNYVYSFVVLLLCFIVIRRITYSTFGYALLGVRENELRMRAIGFPVVSTKLAAYTISAGIAGIAGGLFAQTNAFLTLQVLAFDLSAVVMTVLILGGTGNLYGALVGSIVFLILEDRLAKISPEYWKFGVGLLLILLVLYLPNGLYGAWKVAIEKMARKMR